jgi:outer membrane protein assembly factor BamB
MRVPEGPGRRLLAACFLVLVGTACAAGQAAREPQLTHPPRYQQWLGAQASETEASEFSGPSYAGSFRLPLSEDWSWQMPDPGHWSISRLELAPAVVDGDFVLVGNSRSAGLFVLDRHTGRHLRTIAMEGPVQAAPVRLPDGWLIVDVFGNLQRFDLEFSALWAKPYSIGGAVYRAPVPDGDQVLVATGNDLVVSVALDDGRWRWNYKRNVARNETELAILGAPAPVVVEGEVLQGFSDGYLVAIDRSNGAELWAVQVGDGKFPDIQAEVIVHDDLLIAAAFGGPVVAVDASSHQVRWRNDDAGAVSTMVLSDESLYTSDARGQLHAVDPTTGESQWQWEPRETQLGPPIRVGGALIVGDASGTIYAVDRYEGKEVWRYRPRDGSRPAGVAAAAVVQGRQLVFSSAGGTVYSLISASARATDLSEEPGHRRDRAIGW